MGFFGTLKVMKDIVKGGIETCQADEKLDALLKTVETEHGGALTAEEQALLKKYKALRARSMTNAPMPWTPTRKTIFRRG